MSVHEEVEEHIHHANDPFDKQVAGSMAIIAALLAIVSVLGQHYNTEKLLTQQQASDQWAYYQAKDIRRYTAQIATDQFGKADPALAKRYSSDAAKYKQQTSDIQDKAREFEKERDKLGTQANAFHIGEVFLELAIVLSSLAILAKRRPLFYGALGSGLVGVGIAVIGWCWFEYFVHTPPPGA